MLVASQRRALLAVAAAAALVPVAAHAATQLTAFEKAELAQLTPALQAEVKKRMAQGGQKVREILETMLLNKISLLFAQGRVAAVDFEKGIAVYQLQNGDLKLVPFEVATLDVKKS